MKTINPALACIILAAGKGIRMGPEIPKPLVKFEGRSLLERAITAAQGVNPGALCVVVRHKRKEVEKEALRVCPSCMFAFQDEIPGTGRALECAMEAMEPKLSAFSTVLVTASDLPLLTPSTLSGLLSEHERRGAAATLLSMNAQNPFGYGRVVLKKNWEVRKVVEEKDATEEEKKIKCVNASVYAFQCKALEAVMGKAGRDNSQGEVYLTDLFLLCGKYGKVFAFECQDPLSSRGVNSPFELERLHAEWSERNGGGRKNRIEGESRAPTGKR